MISFDLYLFILNDLLKTYSNINYFFCVLTFYKSTHGYCRALWTNLLVLARNPIKTNKHSCLTVVLRNLTKQRINAEKSTK